MEPKTAIQHRPKRTTMTKGAALPLTMGKASPPTQPDSLHWRSAFVPSPSSDLQGTRRAFAPCTLCTDPGHLGRRRQHCPSTGPSTASSRSADSNPFQRLGEGHSTSTGTNDGWPSCPSRRTGWILWLIPAVLPPNRPGVQTNKPCVWLGSRRVSESNPVTAGKGYYIHAEKPHLLGLLPELSCEISSGKNPSLKKKTVLVHLHRYHPSKSRRARTSECCLLLSPTALLPTTSPPPPPLTTGIGHPDLRLSSRENPL